jgi:hypothetical protein
MVQKFGCPEPMTREALYRRLKVQVKVSMNNKADQQGRVSMVLSTLEQLTQLGMTRSDFNMEPLARMLTSLMGEDDEAETIFKPDGNAMIQSLAQIAKTDPQSISPQAAQVLVNLGGMALQYLQKQGMLPPPGAPGPGGPPGQGAPKPNPGAPAPAQQPAQRPQGA